MNLRVHARELQEETGKSPSPWPEILGALVLALAILAVVGLAPIGLGVGALLVPVAAWLLILLGLYRWVGSEHPWRAALGTFLIGTVLAFIEFLVALVPVVSGRSGVVAYVVGAIVVAIIAIVVLYKRLLWRA